MKACNNCGAELLSGAKFCSICGTKTEEKIVCEGCGTELPNGVIFCHNCGMKVSPSQIGQSTSEPEVAREEADVAEASWDNLGGSVTENVELQTQKCRFCGNTISADTVNCSICGAATQGVLSNINEKDEKGQTALIRAATCLTTTSHIIRNLVTSGADVEEHDVFGRTALMYAAANNNISVVKTLIEEGADINATNEFGSTALIYALVNNSNVDVIKTLISSGAKVNHVNDSGFSPLLCAAQYVSDPNIVKELVTAGANLFYKNGGGKDAFDFATNNPNPKILDVLKRNEINVTEQQ